MGAAVNVASFEGVFGMGSSVAPADSKGTLAMMTKNLARVLVPKIRVDAVAPANVEFLNRCHKPSRSTWTI
jgi:3-oxoacyl-[acyl-carrier protein] reductase